MTTPRPDKRIVDGRAIADAWLGDIAVQVQALGAAPHVAAVAVAPDEGLRSFISLKQKAAQRCGIMFSSYLLEERDVEKALPLMEFLAADEEVHGIFVELPLPDTVDTHGLLAAIPERKDVDRLSPEAEHLFLNNSSDFLPPSVRALQRVLEVVEQEINGIRAAVIGQGRLVGAPVAHWLAANGAEVEVIDEDTPTPERIAREAELVVTGAGVLGLVNADWIGEGATVIDFGYAKKGNAYAGDVDADSVLPRVGVLTPVPGGMGPLVIAATLENLLALVLRSPEIRT